MKKDGTWRQEVSSSSEIKLLEVTINEKLTFMRHINKLFRKAYTVSRFVSTTTFLSMGMLFLSVSFMLF